MYKLSRRAQLLRFIARWIGWILEPLFTRTKIIGKERVPKNAGPYVFAANHASTYDAVLYLLHLPGKTQIVGPGDFRLKRLTRLFIENAGLILTKRGSVDRDSLRQMSDSLKSGLNLALFPEGGTWEKRLDDVKSGAAYLSLVSESAIVPIAISGTYDIWQDIFKLKRPRIIMEFLNPLPPVTVNDRRKRNEELNQFSIEMMEQIYERLTPEEQGRYDLYAHQIYTGKLEVSPDIVDLSDTPDFSVLAELISKKNLFSTFHEHLMLPVAPFLYHSRFYPAREFLAATEGMYSALTTHLNGYLQYRLGNNKSQQGITELACLRSICQQAVEKNVAMCFTPEITLTDEPLPPNT